jgi:hypothetical protein
VIRCLECGAEVLLTQLADRSHLVRVRPSPVPLDDLAGDDFTLDTTKLYGLVALPPQPHRPAVVVGQYTPLGDLRGHAFHAVHVHPHERGVGAARDS